MNIFENSREVPEKNEKIYKIRYITNYGNAGECYIFATSKADALGKMPCELGRINTIEEI